MRRLPLRWLLLVALLVAVVLATGYLTRQKPVLVVLAQASRGAVEQTVANTRAGTIKACRRAKLAPLTGGRVAELPIHKGDKVVAGQLLLKLWNDDLEAQVRMTEAAQVTARARVDEICRNAELAASEARRQDRLVSEGITSAQAIEQAHAAADAGAAACRAAKAAVVEADRRVTSTRAELTRTTLYAPFTGTVAELTAELGEIVTPSPVGIPTPPAVDLIEEGCLYVAAPLDEVDAPRVKVGDRARVTLDAFPGKSFPAHVRRVASYVLDLEKQSRTVDVEAEIEDQEILSRLTPGYSADLEVVLATKPDVLRVPTEAVMEGGLVYIVRDGKIQDLKLQTGISNWQYTEVLSGIAQGEKVVVSLDRAGVKPGAPVAEETSAP